MRARSGSSVARNFRRQLRHFGGGGGERAAASEMKRIDALRARGGDA